ncbi:MAG: cytochrome b N-terminal domain-containing protein [Planctomycetes bacterium]|nr:cytochrome b N-terminal domain-containing protein [Planctomycetota bacterium]MCB9916914.1 cytochrome b N-terminal domain-containing protein [Planctomycetota bacterium]
MLAFLEHRLGLFSWLRELGGTSRPPRQASFLQGLGFATLCVLALVIVTGIGLSFHYVPSADHAYDSIRVLERDVTGGALMRALHYQGTSVLVVLAFLDLCVWFFLGLYKRPREFAWIFGIALFALIVGGAFTGYLLPWDQNAWFATKVRLGILASAPELGPRIRDILQGGSELGSMSLGRFFTLHTMVVPLLIGLVVVMRGRVMRRHGMSPIGLRVDERATLQGPFPSRTTWSKAFLGMLAIAACFVIADRWPAELEAIADPADSNYQPRPEWYFFGPFELLKFFKGGTEAIGAFWLPNALLVVLVLLPFFDRNPERRLRKRPICLIAGALFLVTIGTLTWKGSQDKPTHYKTPAHPLHATAEMRLGYDLTRKEGCFSCHEWNAPDGIAYGHEDKDAPPMQDIEYDPEDLAELLLEPPEEMPAYPHLSESQRVAVGKYVESLRSKD